jgi:CubicO group peptidase (beta-lactamase class C family)
MNPITRRACLKQIGAFAAAATFPSLIRSRPAFALEAQRQPQPTGAESAAMVEMARQFMAQSNIPGLSVAIARHGELVYEAGFGFADTAKREPVTPAHLFRIASVTKPITSVAIFSLIEQGRLGLNDLVFGPKGVLGFDYGSSYPGHLREITVYHLLTHTCGGWANRVNDPMFSNPGMDQRRLIEATLRTCPLEHVPGEHYDYSNFGYCLLGRIVEKVSRQSYGEYVRKSILLPCASTDMQLAGNKLSERKAKEVVYYGQNGEKPYDMPLARMDSHGGWIATPRDLVRFAMHVDGFNTTPSLLRADTIKKMTSPSPAFANYACGWAVNAAPNWWHIGSLPGTISVLVRTCSGLCWGAVINTRFPGADAAIDQFMWKMVKAVPAWRA